MVLLLFQNLSTEQANTELPGWNWNSVAHKSGLVWDPGYGSKPRSIKESPT